jgi:phospholipase D1/2
MAFLEGYRLLKTRHIDDDLSPKFDEEFYCQVAHITEGITFKVKDKDVVKDETLGKYFLPVRELLREVTDADVAQDDSLTVGDLKHVGIHKIVHLDEKSSHGTLEFFVEFFPSRMMCQTMEVPGTYFHEQKGNSVKLYMNADDDGSAPVIKYGAEDGGEEKTWVPPRLWHDLYYAICEAKHFIYAVGWSFDVDQYLLRGADLEAVADAKYSAKFGELLKQKADEGVVVNLMQWDEPSSNFLMPGMMATFDEKTRTFFGKTKVTSKFMGMAGGDFGVGKNLAFTHHQKFVVMDAPKEGGDKRELLGFIGGIDITKGRWDNRKVSRVSYVVTSHYFILLIYSSHCSLL